MNVGDLVARIGSEDSIGIIVEMWTEIGSKRSTMRVAWNDGWVTLHYENWLIKI